MERYEKVYVEMLLRVDTDGVVTPVAFVWEDGARFTIDRVLDERMTPPAHVGAVLTRMYECGVCGRVRKFYLETQTNRWFVEKVIVS